MSELEYFSGELEILDKKEEKPEYVKSFGEGAIYGAFCFHTIPTCTGKFVELEENKTTLEKLILSGGMAIGISASAIPLIPFYFNQYYKENLLVVAIPFITNVISMSYEVAREIKRRRTIDSLVES